METDRDKRCLRGSGCCVRRVLLRSLGSDRIRWRRRRRPVPTAPAGESTDRRRGRERLRGHRPCSTTSHCASCIAKRHPEGGAGCTRRCTPLPGQRSEIPLFTFIPKNSSAPRGTPWVSSLAIPSAMSWPRNSPSPVGFPCVSTLATPRVTISSRASARAFVLSLVFIVVSFVNAMEFHGGATLGARNLDFQIVFET